MPPKLAERRRCRHAGACVRPFWAVGQMSQHMFNLRPRCSTAPNTHKIDLGQIGQLSGDVGRANSGEEAALQVERT